MVRRLVERLGDAATAFEVRSAGTWGCRDAPMEEFAAAALIELGADSKSFRAREIDDEMLVATDLVLTATREHRTHVVGMRPQLVRRAFTLKEFARLADPVLSTPDPSEPTDLTRAALQRIDQAGRLRGFGQRPDPADEDLMDPIGAPLETYRQRAAEIDRACDRAVDLLLGSRH